MLKDQRARPEWTRRARASIGCGAAVAILVTTALTAQAAQAAAPTPLGLTVGGSALTGSGLASATASVAPVTGIVGSGTPVGGTTTAPLLGTGGTSTGSLIGVGSGTNGGITVGVGGGLATVTLGGTAPGNGGTGSGTGTVTVGAPTTTPDPTVTADPAPTAAPALTGVSLDRSTGVVYPKKDGYHDSVSIVINGVTSTGAVTAVTGTATLTKGTKVVKTWKLTKSTQTIVWNGRTGKALKTGKYVLRVAERVAGGAWSTASTTLAVSAKALVKRTKQIATSLTAKTVHNSMPAAVRRAYSKGKVYVQITTVVDRISKSALGKARLVFLNGKKRTYQALVLGTHTSPLLPVPNTKAFRSVTFEHDWKKGSVKLRAIRVVWSYKVLE